MPCIEIESGIPLPPQRRGASAKGSVYKFGELVVDGSLFFPAAPGEHIPSLQRKISSRASQHARWHAGRRYETRVAEKVVDGVTLHGVRVWRVA